MYIVFQATSSKFLLEWNQIQQSPRTPSLTGINLAIQYLQGLYQLVTGNNTCGSDGIIDISEQQSYSFSSPGYPEGYGSKLKCEWIFSTIPQNQLSISFATIDLFVLYGGILCFGDMIEIYTGEEGTQNWNLVSNFCSMNGSNSNKIPPSNVLKVVFTTDNFGNKTGFHASVYNGK